MEGEACCGCGAPPTSSRGECLSVTSRRPCGRTRKLAKDASNHSPWRVAVDCVSQRSPLAKLNLQEAFAASSHVTSREPTRSDADTLRTAIRVAHVVAKSLGTARRANSRESLHHVSLCCGLWSRPPALVCEQVARGSRLEGRRSASRSVAGGRGRRGGWRSLADPAREPRLRSGEALVEVVAGLTSHGRVAGAA